MGRLYTAVAIFCLCQVLECWCYRIGETCSDVMIDPGWRNLSTNDCPPFFNTCPQNITIKRGQMAFASCIVNTSSIVNANYCFITDGGEEACENINDEKMCHYIEAVNLFIELNLVNSRRVSILINNSNELNNNTSIHCEALRRSTFTQESILTVFIKIHHDSESTTTEMLIPATDINTTADTTIDDTNSRTNSETTTDSETTTNEEATTNSTTPTSPTEHAAENDIVTIVVPVVVVVVVLVVVVVVLVVVVWMLLKPRNQGGANGQGHPSQPSQELVDLTTAPPEGGGIQT